MLLLPESELCTMSTFSESSSVQVSPQSLGQHYVNSRVCSDYPASPLSSSPANHSRQLSGVSSTLLASHQNGKWDINDSTLQVCDTYDPFELWPSGHYRGVYRADSDDARRHVSGWAMRNTNNHNALILKKSCLGVLLCSMDCLFESGRKVHLRPAICDKARRKQIGKPCPNQACSGKLTLLSCRGHCGYPVTHFWRHVNNAVYFQAKGYHDHPRPEVKTLSDKGRQTFTKQIKQDGNRSLSTTTKRRYPTLTTDDLADRKVVFTPEDDVLCSCPPFECVCSKSAPHKNLFMPSPFDYLRGAPAQTNTFHAHRPIKNCGQGMDHLAHGSFTQINITNACVPSSMLDISIPHTEHFQNCSKYNHQSRNNDSGANLIRYGVDSIHNSLSHDQRLAKSPLDNLNSQQFLNFYTGHHRVNTASRNVHSSSFISNSYPGNGKDKYRISHCKSNERQAMDDHQSAGVMLKTEPTEPVFNCISASQSEVDDHDFQSEPIYNNLSPSFSTNPLQSPSSLERDKKFELSSDTIIKDLEGQEEPTYITLTSSREYSQENQEFHSCRLAHSTLSPNKAALDSEVYPSPPTQLSRVDIHTPPSMITTIPIPSQDHTNMDICESPSTNSRRSSPTVPFTVFTDNLSNMPVNFNRSNPIHSAASFDRNSLFHTPVNFERNNTLHSPIDNCNDQNRWPFLQTSDCGFVQHPSGNATLEGNTNVPYGFHCNDMFSNPGSQAYRNRSINITLTYN